MPYLTFREDKWMLRDQCPCSQSQWSACQSWDSHFGLFGFKFSFPPYQSMCPLWTAQQVLWTFLLFLCHFSEVHFLLPQLHKRPIMPASDLLPLIGFPRAVVPFQPVHGLILSTRNRLPGGSGSLAADHLSYLFLPSCQPKLLISDLSVLHHSPTLPLTCPSVHLRGLQVTMWQFKAASGKSRNLKGQIY